MFTFNCHRILRSVLPFCGLMFIFTLFHYTNFVLLKYYPVCMNFIFFSTFFLSIFREETVVQKIAKAIQLNLGEYEADYTRKLTYAWATFCFTNFLISVATVYLSDYIWYIYNGCISYMLVGLMFVIEYIVRIQFKKKHNII